MISNRRKWCKIPTKYILAKTGFDTTENEPPKICYKGQHL